MNKDQSSNKHVEFNDICVVKCRGNTNNENDETFENTRIENKNININNEVNKEYAKLNSYNKTKINDNDDSIYNESEEVNFDRNARSNYFDITRTNINTMNNNVLAATRKDKAIKVKMKSPYKPKESVQPNKNESIKRKDKLIDNPITINTNAMKHNSTISDNALTNNNVEMDDVEGEYNHKRDTRVKNSIEITNDYKKRDHRANEEQIDKNKTEKLEQLDVSIINGKNISNAKRKAKEERIKEIKESVVQNRNKESKQKIYQVERHIRLMKGFENFKMDDLIGEIASTEVTTKLVHLLDLFPKFRTAFSQKLRLEPPLATNTITNVITAINKNKIVKVNGLVEGVNTGILLDSCASVNMVSREFLRKLKSTLKPIGRIMETIFQAFSNTNTHTDIYKLKIKIGSYTFEEKFRVIEKSDLFDLLVGIDSLKRNRFILDFVNDKLYLIDNSDYNVEIAHLRYDIKLPMNSDSEKREI